MSDRMTDVIVSAHNLKEFWMDLEEERACIRSYYGALVLKTKPNPSRLCLANILSDQDF